MDTRTAATAYRQASIENAPPAKIICLLYDGALRFIDRALRCDPKDPSSPFVEWVSRADAIVCELRLCLDHEHDEDLSRNLERLYLFCERQFAESLVARELEALQGARSVLAILGDAWSEIELQAQEVA